MLTLFKEQNCQNQFLTFSNMDVLRVIKEGVSKILMSDFLTINLVEIIELFVLK